MTEKVDRYRQAARCESTERRYQQSLAHFEETWDGFLPATSEAIARYLADYVETLASSTLRANLAALAKWHLSQGFPDPTKAPHVREVLRGIQALHPRLERQAEPVDPLHRLADGAGTDRPPRPAELPPGSRPDPTGVLAGVSQR